MPIFTIQVDGHKLRIQAPDEATALSEANAWKPEKAKPSGPVFDPVKDAKRAFAPLAESVKSDMAALRAGKPASINPMDNPVIGGVAATVQALTNQITGPASRAIGRTALPIYEKPAAPGSDGFGRAPQRLEGEARDSAFEDVLNSALSSVRAGVPRAWVGGKTAGFERVLPAPKRVAPTPVERKVATAVERAIQRDAMTPADVMARTEKGVPAFHAGGENLTSLAEVAAQSPGSARRVLRSAVRDYSATAPTRVKADIATELGGRGDYFATMEAKQAQRAAKAKPLLEEAFAAPIDPVVFSDKVQPILGRLPKGSLEQAYDIARREGRNPVDMGFEVSPASGDIPAMVTVKNPTTETLHYVKKGIDQTLEQYRNPVTRELDLSGSPGAQVDSQVRKTLARTMRDINPKYDEGMKVWGDESERLNALELGRNVFSPKMDMKAERLKGMVDDLSEAARDDFRKGVGEAVLDRVRGSRGDVGVMRDLLKNEEFGDRVALAFPDDASFARFMESAAKRVAEQDRNNQVFGGSPTYARQAARADLEAEGNPAIEMAADVLTLDGKALGKKALSAGLKSRNPSIISNPMMNELLGRVMADPDELTALLNLLQASRASSASRAAIARQAAVPALTQAAAQKDR